MWWKTNSRVDPAAPLLGDGGSPAAVVDADGPESAPAAPEMAGTPLSPGRGALASAIDELRRATGAIDNAATPARRLEKIIAEARELDELIAGHADEYAGQLGAWLADTKGERPTPPAGAASLCARRSAMAEDLAGAEVALAGAQAVEQQAAERVAAASRGLDEALPIAALEAARELLPALRRAIDEVLRVEGLIRGLEGAARAAGNKPNAIAGYITSANLIAEEIAEIKRSATAPVDIAAGERLLAALASDPTAVLQ